MYFFEKYISNTPFYLSFFLYQTELLCCNKLCLNHIFAFSNRVEPSFPTDKQLLSLRLNLCLSMFASLAINNDTDKHLALSTCQVLPVAFLFYRYLFALKKCG